MGGAALLVDPRDEIPGQRHLPHYSTSLDAIFAAEERLGLHDFNNGHLRCYWLNRLSDALISSTDLPDRIDVTAACLSASPVVRTGAFILAAQYKKKL